MGEYMGDGFVDFFVMPQLVLGLCPDIVGVVVQHGRELRGFLRVFGSRGEIALIQLALSNCKNRGGFLRLSTSRVVGLLSYEIWNETAVTGRPRRLRARTPEPQPPAG